jgi:DNA primase
MPLYREDKISTLHVKIVQNSQELLRSHKESKRALDYLYSREIDDDLISKYKIGYFPTDIKIPDKYSYLKNLSGRAIFPIMDEYGDTVALSGRLIEQKEDELKWWHESFPKMFFFYGLNVALEYILKRKFVFLVEGQADVIACHKYKLFNTIGLMGSSFTSYQMAKISRLTNNFVLMLDGDTAGRKAAKDIKETLFYWNSGKQTYNYYDIDLNELSGETKIDPDLFLKKFGSNKIISKLKKLKESN